MAKDKWEIARESIETAVGLLGEDKVKDAKRTESLAQDFSELNLTEDAKRELPKVKNIVYRTNKGEELAKHARDPVEKLSILLTAMQMNEKEIKDIKDPLLKGICYETIGDFIKAEEMYGKVTRGIDAKYHHLNASGGIDEITRHPSEEKIPDLENYIFVKERYREWGVDYGRPSACNSLGSIYEKIADKIIEKTDKSSEEIERAKGYLKRAEGLYKKSFRDKRLAEQNPFLKISDEKDINRVDEKISQIDVFKSRGKGDIRVKGDTYKLSRIRGKKY